MILDSSAIVALLLAEPGHEELLERLRASDIVAVGALTLAETAIVLGGRLGVPGRTLVARFVEENEIVVVPFAREHWQAAVDAFLRFGKGRHRAGLNFGDCLTYATARLADEPLLALGGDFAQTDLALVP